MNSKMVRVHIDKKAFFHVDFDEAIILVYKNLDHGWSGRWLVDDLVRVHLDNFFEWKTKIPDFLIFFFPSCELAGFSPR